MPPRAGTGRPKLAVVATPQTQRAGADLLRCYLHVRPESRGAGRLCFQRVEDHQRLDPLAAVLPDPAGREGAASDEADQADYPMRPGRGRRAERGTCWPRPPGPGCCAPRGRADLKALYCVSPPPGYLARVVPSRLAPPPVRLTRAAAMASLWGCWLRFTSNPSLTVDQCDIRRYVVVAQGAFEGVGRRFMTGLELVAGYLVAWRSARSGPGQRRADHQAPEHDP